MTQETVGSIAGLVAAARVIGDEGQPIVGVADLRQAGPQHLGFLNDQKLEAAAKETRAAALLVKDEIETPAAQILVPNVYAAFARVALHFHPLPTATEHAVHESAVVAADAVLEKPVRIGPGAVIGAGARIGAGSIVGASVVIGDRCTIGTRCTLHPGVVLYPGMRLGDRVILHAGCVVGADGFGYAQDDDGSYVKFPQLGTVVIEDDVEIGANTTIDRAALGATRIGRGSKIDNLVQIGHNCDFGEHTAVAGFSAFSGSTVLGDRVQIAGHAVSAGHLEVAADTRIGGNSVFHRDIEKPDDYVGYPLQPKRKWFRTMRAIDNIVELQDEVRKLRARLADRDGED
jgi:UDP-3-O-[3-hydroxymyristoyl] glucosamine N-acyltransferase